MPCDRATLLHHRTRYIATDRPQPPSRTLRDAVKELYSTPSVDTLGRRPSSRAEIHVRDREPVVAQFSGDRQSRLPIRFAAPSLHYGLSGDTVPRVANTMAMAVSTLPATAERPGSIARPHRASTPFTGIGYDDSEGIISSSRYTLFLPSDCPNNWDHLSWERPRGLGHPVFNRRFTQPPSHERLGPPGATPRAPAGN